MKIKNSITLSILSLLTFTLVACGGHTSPTKRQVMDDNSTLVEDTVTTKATTVDTYLVLTPVGLFDGQPGESIPDLYLENAVKYSAESGSDLPGKDHVTTIESSKGEFSHWARYDEGGALTTYTKVPNRSGSIFYAVFDADGSGNASDIGGSTNEKMKVYFQAPTSWTTANIYYWTTGEDGPNKWPGVAMNKENNTGLYSYTYDTLTYQNVIFNNGNAQTGDLESPTSADADCYFWDIKDWRNEDYVVDPDDIPVSQTMRVYFRTTQWSTVYIYVWGSGPKVAWPGEIMSKDTSTGLFYFDYDVTTYPNVIFNNGPNGPQTADLKSPISENADCYNHATGQWENN